MTRTARDVGQGRRATACADQRGTAAVEFALVLPIALEAEALSVATARAGSMGDPVTVTLIYDAPIRVPFVSWLFPSGVTMRAGATSRQEFA